MKELLDNPIFTVAGQTYLWADAAVAAHLWGDWAALENETRQSAACLKKADDTGDGPTRASVESAANEFRYAHDLITAQETQNWLTRWGLGVEEWKGYFRRKLLVKKWAEHIKEITIAHAVTDAEVDELIAVDAICSGRLAEWARKLAGRAAVRDRLNEAQETNRTLDEAIKDLLQAVAPEVRAKGLANLSPESFEQKLEAAARSEAAFELFRREVITAKAIKDRLASHYLDWIRFDCGYVSFADEAAAKEAALCVREDGLELAEVAKDAKRPFHQAVMYLDQLEPQLKEHILAAQSGSLVGPVKSGDEHILFWLNEKQMPSENDPEIRRRAEEAIVKSAVNHEINNRVQWIVRL